MSLLSLQMLSDLWVMPESISRQDATAIFFQVVGCADEGRRKRESLLLCTPAVEREIDSERERERGREGEGERGGE